MPAGPAAPDDAAAISVLAREHGYAAIDALASALDDDDVEARVAAAIALLTIGYGQPVQPMAFDAHGVVLEVHTLEAPDRRANGEDADDRSAWSARVRER